MTVNSFKDHFSGHAELYARYRPGYPQALYQFLGSLCDGNDLAWDCGCGNGQAATGLAPYFKQVVGTDASEQQISQARPASNVRYAVATAAASGLETASVDLAVAAQALHWFDLTAFTAEVDRVLCHGGVLAVWTYQMARVSPEIDAIVDHLYGEVVGSYWPPERRLVEAGYKDMALPFTELEVPVFSIEANWTRSDLLNYLRTWSATRRYQEEHHEDPVALIEGEMALAWAGEVSRPIHWPIALRAAQKS